MATGKDPVGGGHCRFLPATELLFTGEFKVLVRVKVVKISTTICVEKDGLFIWFL